MVQTGSVYEDEHEAGYAHFVEHVLFRGSKGQSRAKTERFLKRMGIPVALHGQGGSTALDRTMYSLPLPETPDKHLSRALDILAARVSRPLFKADDVDAERDIVLAEEQQRRASPASKERQIGLYGADHPLVNKTPIGTRDSLGSATVAQLRGFFERWYRPDRMVVVVVGDIDPARAVKAVRKSFGRLRKSDSPAQPVIRVGPPAGRHAMVVEDEKVEVRGMGLTLMKPLVRVDTVPEYYRSTAGTLGLDMLRSRLRDFRDETPELTGVSVGVGAMLDIHSTRLNVVADDDHELTAFQAVVQIARSAIEAGFSEEEIATAEALQRQGLRSAEERQFRVPGAAVANSWLGSLHRDVHPTSTDAYLEAVRHSLDRMQPEHIRQELARLFDADRRALVATVPKGETLVAGLETFLAEIEFIDALEVSPVVPGEKDVIKSTGPTRDDPFALPGLEPAAVVATRRHPEIGVVQWTLANGVEVLFKRDEQPNTPVTMRYRSSGGVSLLDDYDIVRTQLAREVIIGSGMRGLKSSALVNLFRLHRTNASVVLAEREHGFSLTTFPDELDFAFRALHLIATEAQVSTDVLESLRAKTRNVLTATVANPGFQFNAAVSDVLWPGRKLNPGSMDPDRLDDVTTDWVRQVYDKLFEHAGGTYLLVAGPVDEAVVYEAVTRYVGTLPGGKARVAGGSDFPLAKAPAEVRHTTNPDDRSVGTMYFLEPAPGHDEYANFVRGAYASLLTGRLVEEIREKRSLVYSISARATSPRYPNPHAMLTVSYVADPDNVAEIEGAVLKVMEALPGSLKERELKPIRKSLHRSFEETLEKPALVLQMLYIKILQDKPLPALKAYRDHIDNLDTASIAQFGKRALTSFVQVRTEYGPGQE